MSEQLPTIIDQTKIIGDARVPVVPAPIAAAGERLAPLFGILRGEHPQPAHAPGLRRALAEFMAWCEDNEVSSITAVQPLHVAAWIEMQTREHAAPDSEASLGGVAPSVRLAGDRPDDAGEPGVNLTIVSPAAISENAPRAALF